MPATNSDAATGMNLAREGRFADALPFLERANRAAPTDVAVLNAVGNLLVLAGRGDDADARYRIAARLLPNELKLLCGWARVCLMRNQTAQAVEVFGRAIAVDRRCANPGGWVESIVREILDADAACEALQALVDANAQHSGLRAVQAKALMAAERLADAQRAFDAYRAMCPRDVWVRVELGGLAAGRADAATARAYFRDALAMDPINPDALWGLAELDGYRLDGPRRTQVQRAIDAKPIPRACARLHDILARSHDRAGETETAWRHASKANALLVEATPAANRYSTAQHERRVDTLVRHYDKPLLDRLRGAGHPDRRPVFVTGMPRSGTTLLERMLASHPDIVGVGEQRFAEASWKRALHACGNAHDGLTEAAVHDAAAWHLRTLEQRMRNLGLPANAARIVDKLPDNYMMAGWLGMAFPNATLIHVRRDPRDVALSCWLSQFGDDATWINDLDHIAHRIEQHRRMRRHWLVTMAERLIEVRYEELIADPESQLRRLLAAMEMPWHPAVLAFADHGGYVATASRQQVREPLHARSLARWRAYAGALEPILGRLDAIAIEDELDFDGRHPAMTAASVPMKETSPPDACAISSRTVRR